MHIVKYHSRSLILDNVTELYILKFKSVNMSGINTISRKNAPITRFRVHAGKLRHIVRCRNKALFVLVPAHSRKKALVFQEKCIYKPRQDLCRRLRTEL